MADDPGDILEFPISPEIAGRLAEKDGPDAPVRSSHERMSHHRACSHPRATIDMEGRSLSCSECGAVIDPLTWIDTFAREWDGYIWRWKDARRRVKAMEEKVAALERKEKNLKARVRNAEHPALKEARQALAAAEKVLWEAQAKLDFDPTLKQKVTQVWARCRRAAAALHPMKASA